MTKKTILLYNPSAPYYTIPLQFLALASVIDRSRFDVRIIDARIESSVESAHRKVRKLLPTAMCLGISVITGSPLRDAAAVSRLARTYAPQVPIVWGGWHPSIYPDQCLTEGPADFCVSGQGELTFLELLDALEAGTGYEAIRGLSFSRNGEIIRNPERPFTNVAHFPAYDYDLVPLERYFQLKQRRQIDFYSSQGCPYRCAFCADPSVYGRRWSGLKGTRLLTEVLAAVKRFRVEDVVFQDENFFASRNRVMEFCEGVIGHHQRFSWAATSRADQIALLEDALLERISKAGLRKVIIGAESGSQEMLDMMKKDTLAEEALISADKLARHGIGAAFGFIVGFPEERFDDTMKTLRLIKQIKRINPEFEFNIFFYTPYPGTELFRYIVDKGYTMPSSLVEWSVIDFATYAGYWIRRKERRYVERFKFYTKLGTEQMYRKGWTRPLHHLAAYRARNDYFDFPVEQEIVNFVRYKVLGQPNW